MLLNRADIRLPLTVVGSLFLHAFLVYWLGPTSFSHKEKMLKLTDVEYQEEVVKPTEIEKLMNKIAAPTQPPSATDTLTQESIAELEKHSFAQAVGIQHRPMAENEVTEKDLSQLAPLPKMSAPAVPAAPMALAASPKRIVLKPVAANPDAELESNLGALAALPAADFGPGLSTHEFQKPEMIVKKVKAERREKIQTAPNRLQQSLRNDASILGEVQGREVLHRESPVVPRVLEEKGIEAEVRISFVVNPEGDVGDKMFVDKTSGYDELDRSAMAALKKFQFAPLPLSEKQVEQKGIIVMRFTFRQG